MMVLRQIGDNHFERAGTLEPEKAQDRSFLEFMPQSRYQNRRNLPLNPQGIGPFCRFSIPSKPTGEGV
jgi:hypothetical protein